MTKTVPAIYENGVFRPLQPLTLPEHQQVHLLVTPEDPATLASTQRQALADLEDLGSSGRSDIATAHDSYIYQKNS